MNHRSRAPATAARRTVADSSRVPARHVATTAPFARAAAALALAATTSLGAGCGGSSQVSGASLDALVADVELGDEVTRAEALTQGLTAALTSSTEPGAALDALGAFVDAHLEEMREVARAVATGIDRVPAAEQNAAAAALDRHMSDAVFAWHDALAAFRDAHAGSTDRLDAILMQLGTQYEASPGAP